jgi:hypothetical protein
LLSLLAEVSAVASTTAYTHDPSGATSWRPISNPLRTSPTSDPTYSLLKTVTALLR